MIEAPSFEGFARDAQLLYRLTNGCLLLLRANAEVAVILFLFVRDSPFNSSSCGR